MNNEIVVQVLQLPSGITYLQTLDNNDGIFYTIIVIAGKVSVVMDFMVPTTPPEGQVLYTRFSIPTTRFYQLCIETESETGRINTLRNLLAPYNIKI